MENLPRPKRVYAAVWMLYSVSILGLLDLLTSSTLMMHPVVLIWLDVIAYVILIVIAFIISLGFSFAKILYTIAAIIWYALLIFYLPETYGHALNMSLAFIEIILIISALFILYQPKAVRWFKGQYKAA